ncbi:hypothetical protein [Limnoglobus roseus]|uniref:Carboxypeptidase regulatory-like domain-containing protein n=1 Tax=Limnoglobus roseus TaxID=2598579 RepID=A0A5C1AIU7_9BACT|nr:hypothetical protein [Limnoglobus roseus]QEL16334.1 carboxypeptidase regulatory-like domain-containing protein [Limnoglobus roseus]QEL17926.1 carboxypeptidase regulatory-like domain-containing protein [Limnoglobus roseus]
MRIRFFYAVAGVVALLGAGCTRTEPPAYPVEFEVQVLGKPAAGATVVLHPVGKADPKVPLPTGRVDAAGTVKLSTFAHEDGAPPGEYAVTIEWRPEVVVTVGSDKITEFAADKLKGKYGKPTAPAAPRVTVKKEPNKLPPLQL